MRTPQPPGPRPFEGGGPTVLSPTEPRRLLLPGRVTPLYRGWASVQPPTPPEGVGRAAHADTTALIAASHAGLRTEHWYFGESAAVIWGCDTVGLDGHVHLAQRHNQQRSAHPKVHRHCVTLTPSELTVVDGYPVTTLGRTLVDCARMLSARQALVIADSALRRGLPTDELAEAIDRASGSRGIRQARAVLALADARAESPGETLVRFAVGQAEMPPLELQIPVDTHLGRKYVDLGWPEVKVAIEFDGRIKYDTSGGGAATAFYEEKRRQDALAEAGWLVVRVMWEDLQRPAALAARLWDAIRRQRRHHRSARFTPLP